MGRMSATKHDPEAILFISGAGLPDWIWDGTRELLSPDHTTAVAPRPSRAEPSLRDHARAALAAAPAERFSVVAHSAGGMVAAELLRLAPERVTGLLGFSAVIPEPGNSYLSAMPFPNSVVLSLVMRMTGTRPPNAMMEKSLTDRLDPEVGQRLVAEFTPESQKYYRDRVRRFRFPERSGYVFTTEDHEIVPKLQRSFALNLRANHMDSLTAGHLPMLELPVESARAIRTFLRAEQAGPD